MAFSFILLNIWFHLSFNTDEISPLRINMISPGILGFNSLPSLSYVGPGIETGLQHLRDAYPQHQWISTYLQDERILTCAALLDNVQDMLSIWYYQQRDEKSLNFIVTSGKKFSFIVQFQKKSFSFSLKNFVSKVAILLIILSFNL
jgi:hypothetical protein